MRNTAVKQQERLQAILDQIPADHPLAGARLTASRGVGGGCINETERLETDRGPVFLKRHRPDQAELYAGEAHGLSLLAPHIRVPAVLAHGVTDDHAWLLLEWLDIGGGDDEERLGEQLAALHRQSGDAFGLDRDNHIGATDQINGWDRDWVRFYADKRLAPQLDWAAARGLDSGTIAVGERLIDALPAFFSDYRPRPALIHGDLWGGNHGFLTDGTPVLFDPAAYYADREAEIAMTELFGGLSSRFRAAYEAIWPLDAGYRVRRDLYNLYHVLNHFNLFGGGYGRQAGNLIARLSAQH